MSTTAAAERKPGTGEGPPAQGAGPAHPPALRAVRADADGDERDQRLEALVREQLGLLGEAPEREGLVRTPERVRRALDWLTRGYRLDPEEVVGDAHFEEPHEGMILVRDVEMYSMCEHHMLPFFGRVHVAYIPNGKIVGLSKLPRIVEVYARRLQVQERLTEQIADAVDRLLQPRGIPP